MTFQRIHQGTKQRQTPTESTEYKLTSRPFAPIQQTTPSPHQQGQQTEGLVQRKTNLLEIPGLFASPKRPKLPNKLIQAKLTIGQPGDKYEREADETARQVVQRIHNPPSQQQPQQLSSEDQLQTKSVDNIQRQELSQMEATKLELQAEYGKITPEGQERLTQLQAKMHESLKSRLQNAFKYGHNLSHMAPRTSENAAAPIQAKLAIGLPGDKYDQQLQTQPMVQRRMADSGIAAPADVEAGIQKAKGGGQPLASSIKQPMEQAFGANFSGVRIHTDSQADQLNQSIQAKAFTTEQHVFFRQGAYEPESRGGQELIAHELTHVVQQGKAGNIERKKIGGQVTCGVPGTLRRKIIDKGKRIEDAREAYKILKQIHENQELYQYEYLESWLLHYLSSEEEIEITQLNERIENHVANAEFPPEEKKGIRVVWVEMQSLKGLLSEAQHDWDSVRIDKDKEEVYQQNRGDQKLVKYRSDGLKNSYAKGAVYDGEWEEPHAIEISSVESKGEAGWEVRTNDGRHRSAVNWVAGRKWIKASVREDILDTLVNICKVTIRYEEPEKNDRFRCKHIKKFNNFSLSKPRRRRSL